MDLQGEETFLFTVLDSPMSWKGNENVETNFYSD